MYYRELYVKGNDAEYFLAARALNNIDITSKFEIHKAKRGLYGSNPDYGIKMAKRSLYETAWILGLIAGVVCILFALFSFFGYIPEILEKPIKGLTGMVSAGVLGILGFLILGAARMTKAGGKRATTGGIFLLIFGFVAYLAGGAIGALIAILTGLLAIIVRYV